MPLSFAKRAKLQVKSVYARVTLNPVTAGFFVFGFLHCFAQGIMHSFLFTVDEQYYDLVHGITGAAQIDPKNHTVLHYKSGGEYALQMCNYIPHTSASCFTIFDTSTTSELPGQDPIIRGKTILNSIGHNDVYTTNISSVTLMDRNGTTLVTLSQTCTGMLLYPKQLLQNYQREDLTWVILQFWLFAISLTAMIFDSVPHILAGLAARVLATAWSMQAIYRTLDNKKIFNALIETAGTPCSAELFDEYSQTRLEYEIPDLILNFSALLASGYLSWTLLKVYNSQSFKTMGAPPHVIRVYRYFMAVQACLQLETFVLLTAMGLWIDQLFNSYIHDISAHTTVYEGAVISTTIIIAPWLAAGWFAIRREMRLLMVGFLAVTFCLIAGWAIMFYSQVYRWTFVAWPGLACFMTSSFILLVMTIVLGVICRMNFGQGLSQYLHAESMLASSNFAASVFEHTSEPEKSKMSLDSSFPPRTPGFGASVIDELRPTVYLPSLSRLDTDRRDSLVNYGSPIKSPVAARTRGASVSKLSPISPYN